MSTETNDRMTWWRDARFGMFIHWGIYSVPAGTWKGERIPSLGEWIMRNARIPISEYEKLAGQFNPVKFDADAWVRLAKRAGMRYLVITSKHHDGFCLFRSPSNPYNIIDATPFDRDPMSELAKACQRHGLKLGFYYSQSQDWHAPGGAGHWEEAEDVKNWHKYPGRPEDFANYLEDVVKPNLHELLTQYGPIGLIWFDTPVCITREQSEDLRDLVHELQPDCLVSGRVGNDVGDYGSMGDNQIPVGRVEGDWETPATLNDTWGFKSYDHNWKSVETLLYLLVDLASKGVNYLLNVGPTALGEIPQPSIELLEGIGAWMDVNGEAIHGSRPSPYPYEFDWGRMTQKDKTIYLLITEWPGETLRLSGLRSRVDKAVLLASPETEVPFTEAHDKDNDTHDLSIQLPSDPPDACISVLRLDLTGDVDVDESPQQQADGSICLPAHMAGRPENLSLSRSGITENWLDTGPVLNWTFTLRQAGTYRVDVYTAGNRHHGWHGGHTLRLEAGGSTTEAELVHDRDSDSPRSQYFPEVISELGVLNLAQTGSLTVSLQATALASPPHGGVGLSEVRLVPVG